MGPCQPTNFVDVFKENSNEFSIFILKSNSHSV